MRPRRSRAVPAPLQCSPMTQKITPGTAVLLVIPPLLWAGNAVASRLAVGNISPMTVTALRWPLGLALLYWLVRDGARAMSLAAGYSAPAFAFLGVDGFALDGYAVFFHNFGGCFGTGFAVFHVLVDLVGGDVEDVDFYGFGFV